MVAQGPYGLRFFLELPHPFITRKRLREVLAPRPGERAEAAGLCFERRVGGRLGYFARFRAPRGRTPARQENKDKRGPRQRKHDGAG